MRTCSNPFIEKVEIRKRIHLFSGEYLNDGEDRFRPHGAFNKKASR